MSSSFETRIAEADGKLELVETLLQQEVEKQFAGELPDASNLTTALRHLVEARSKLRGEL